MTDPIDISDLFPPHDPLFDSPWLKWGQAVVHTQALEANVETFAEEAHRQPLARHRVEYHPQRHGFAILVDEIFVQTPVRWGLLLGDVVNNYRSALDQLAWALVSRGRTPPDMLTKKKQKGIYFPLSVTREDFNAKIPVNLPGVRRADIAFVRAAQPYKHRPKAKRQVNCLLLLAEINTVDKHRTIQPVLDVPEFASYNITEFQDCVLSKLPVYAERVPLQIDTEMAFIRVRKTGPNPHIEVEPDVVAQPAVNERVWLRDWLDLTLRYVFLLLQDFSGPPDELMTVGIDWGRLNLDPDA